MFWRNLWLKVPLLFAVVGQAELFEALTHRARPWWPVGLVLIIGSLVIPLLGEWMGEEATTARWRRRGWAVAAAGALLHLALDAACLALPWIGGPGWMVGLAGVVVGASIMTILLRGYVAAIRDPEAFLPPLPVPQGKSWPARLWRGAWLLGGDAIVLMAVGVAIAIAAAVLLIIDPDARGDAGGWFALVFFCICAVTGLAMGLERRALILGRPPPFAWPQLLRRLGRRGQTYVVARDGLLAVDRRGATLYRWGDIEAVWAGTAFNNPAVCVRLVPDASPERMNGGDAGRALARDAKARAWSRGLFEADLVIFSPLAESGPGPLLFQLGDSLADPARRAPLPEAADEIRRLRCR
jgi:hypothetical protein